LISDLYQQPFFLERQGKGIAIHTLISEFVRIFSKEMLVRGCLAEIIVAGIEPAIPCLQIQKANLQDVKKNEKE
jgi:hypothetical protein